MDSAKKVAAGCGPAATLSDELAACQRARRCLVCGTRTHLRELGLERRAVDSVFRQLDTVVLPGYRRPMVKGADYLELIQVSRNLGPRSRGGYRTRSPR
jgi:hypothetical protein